MKKSTPFKPAASAIAISIAAAFALSACGGGGDDTSRVSAKPDSTTATNVTVGTSKVVKVTFTSQDGTSTNLAVNNLNSLPDGWSANQPFACATVTSSGTGCQLTLTYTPTQVTSQTTLALNYSYTDDDGNRITNQAVPAISYSAVAPSGGGTALFGYVTQLDGTSGSMLKCNVASDGVLTCATQADASTSTLPAPEAIAFNDAKTAVYVLNTPVAPTAKTISKCNVTDGTVSSCASEAGATELDFVSDIAVNGNNLYTLTSNTILKCSIDSSGSLGACVEASAAPSGLGFGESFAINGSNVWVADSSGNGSIKACAVTAGTGDIAACTSAVDFPAQVDPADPSLPPGNAPIAIAFDAAGTNAYVILRDYKFDGAIQPCTVTGSTMTCNPADIVALPTAVAFAQPDRIAVQGGFVYVTRGQEVFKAAIGSDGKIAAPGFTAAVSNASSITGEITDIAF